MKPSLCVLLFLIPMASALEIEATSITELVAVGGSPAEVVVTLTAPCSEILTENPSSFPNPSMEITLATAIPEGMALLGPSSSFLRCSPTDETATENVAFALTANFDAVAGNQTGTITASTSSLSAEAKFDFQVAPNIVLSITIDDRALESVEGPTFTATYTATIKNLGNSAVSTSFTLLEGPEAGNISFPAARTIGVTETESFEFVAQYFEEGNVNNQVEFMIGVVPKDLDSGAEGAMLPISFILRAHDLNTANGTSQESPAFGLPLAIIGLAIIARRK